jgi:hypothetical protein
MTEIQSTPEPVVARPRVSVDTEVWAMIDRLLGDLPFKTAAPIVGAIHQYGGVQPVKA